MTVWKSQCQTKPVDLNSPERVAALYKINEQRKAYKKQLDYCKTDVANLTKSIDSLTQIAVDMNLETKDFLSHNQDLQAGLLGLLEENSKQDVKIAKLEAMVKKYFTVGIQAGATWDFTKDKVKPYFGIGVSRTIFKF